MQGETDNKNYSARPKAMDEEYIIEQSFFSDNWP